MDKTAVRHAWERLHKARNAHKALVESQTIEQAQVAWSDFLTAAHTVFVKLEKGSKGHRKSEPWFGRIKHERRKDELLRYVHHARNTDEHGIQDVTRRQPGEHFLEVVGGAVYLDSITVDTRTGAMSAEATPVEPGGSVVARQLSDTIHLVRVYDDKYDEWFEVPTTHQGKPLQGDSPAEVAALALEYLERIVREGSELTK